MGSIGLRRLAALVALAGMMALALTIVAAPSGLSAAQEGAADASAAQPWGVGEATGTADESAAQPSGEGEATGAADASAAPPSGEGEATGTADVPETDAANGEAASGETGAGNGATGAPGAGADPGTESTGNLCKGGMGHVALAEAMQDRKGLSGRPHSVQPPDDLPQGEEVAVTLDLTRALPDGVSQTGLAYRVYAKRRGSSDGSELSDTYDAQELSLVSVASDVSARKDTVTFRLENRAGEPLMEKSWFWSRYDFLVVGCRPDASQPSVHVTFVGSVTDRILGGVWAAVAAAFALGLLAWAVRHQSPIPPNPIKLEHYAALFLDFRGRVSLNRVQVAIFTVVVAGCVAYSFGRTGILSDLSESVLLLLGIVAAATTGAAAADTQRHRLRYDNFLFLRDDLNWVKEPDPYAQSFSQIFEGSGRTFDIVRFQSFVFTLVVVATVIDAALFGLSSLEIPEGILYVLGLSQATYIGGKLVSPPTVMEFDQMVTEARAAIEGAADDAAADKARDEARASLKAAFKDVFGYEAGA